MIHALSDVATFRGEGHIRGYAEGKAEGKAEGIIEGESRGEARGATAKMLQIAKNMFVSGEPAEKITAYTGLTGEMIESLKD